MRSRIQPQRNRPEERRVALPRCVSRTLDAMRAYPRRALMLADLAAIGGVSTRTLQRLFRAFLGKTPLAALRDIRLECARRDLIRSSLTGTVTDIAQRSGFSHLGRFSLEYHRRYGEKPSQTLQRRMTFLARQPAQLRLPALDPRAPAVMVEAIHAGEDSKALADSIVGDLATALLRTGTLVANRRSRYRLQGTLRSEGKQRCLTLRLVDTETSWCIWAHRHCGTTEDEFLAEERLAGIAAAMQPRLLSAEIVRARRKLDFDLTARDLALRAFPNVLSLDPEGNTRALELLTRALVSDPDDPLATALAAWCHAQRVVYQFATAPTEDRAQAFRLGRRALSLGGDATVLSILGNAFCLTGDVETAELAVQRALGLDGSSAWAWARSGMIDLCRDRPEAAIEQLTIALDLAPDDPLVFNVHMALGSAHFYAGRNSEAVHSFERAIREHPSALWAESITCPAYMLCGRKAAARHSLASLQRSNPELTIARVLDGFSFFPEHFRNRIADGLEGAGLPP
jgi:AraC-like DNA-binding protein/tetratricopeptide (TPR) repeat protein